ncbi:MAG: hypothetical protein Q8M22_04605 [Actinomycetota bacterium]|nr:hypothetical protein [Actinomycetota bacterium]
MNDPYGRYQQRYWNGSEFTEHVATNGVQQVDPLGASPVIPFATPPSAYEAPGAPATLAALGDPPSGNAVTRFLDGMGADAAERPRPGFGAALSGIGGFLVGIGFLIIVLGDDVSRGKSIAATFALLAAALALRLFVKVPVVQSAAVGMVVLAIPAFATALTVSDGSSGVVTYLLATALFLAAWALKGFKGRTLLLGLGALTMVGMFSTIISSAGNDKCETYIEEGDFDRYFEECEDYSGSTSFLPSSVTDNVGEEGIVFLLCAALLLGLTWWLDRRGYHGTATGTVVAGLLSAVAGTALLADDFGSDTGPVLVFVVGILVCVVGAHGSRRATTWWGALLAAIGLVSFVVVQWEPDSTGSAGGVAVVSGLLLVALGLASAPIRKAMEQRQSPQAPTGFGPPDHSPTSA